MVEFEYHGFSSFSLFDGNTHIVVDPWIEEPDWTVRSIESFDTVDYIFVTHGAFDHLGDTLTIAQRSGAEVITEPAVADHLIGEGLPEHQITTMIWGNALSRDNVSIRALETRHLSYFKSSDQYLSGIPLGFLFDFDETSIYNIGDTSIFRNIKTFAALYEPTWATIPVGGAPGHLSPLPPEEAALTAKWIEPEAVIPIHYPPGNEAVAEFEKAVNGCFDDGTSPAIHPMTVGGRLTL